MKRKSFAVALEQPGKTPEAGSGPKSGERQKQTLEDRLTFGFSESDHPLVEKYLPVYLARGGEHLVYDMVGRPDVVVKGNKKVLYDTLIADPFSPDQDKIESSAALRMAKLKLEHDRKMREKLLEHFGREHLLPQKTFLTKVPVTQPILEELEKQFDPHMSHIGALPTDATEAWTLLTVQRRQELPKDQIECPKSSYPERAFVQNKNYLDPIKRAGYARVQDAMMRGDTMGKINVNDFLNQVNTEPLDHLAKQMAKDEELTTVVRDFVTRAIAFAEDTGEILDVIGNNNIVFLKEDGKWTYKLVDPLYPFDDYVLEKGREAYLDNSPPEKMSSKDHNALVHAVVFTRLINGLALLSDGPYMDFLPQDLMDVSMADKIFPKAVLKKAA